jgi:hypothetical protein
MEHFLSSPESFKSVEAEFDLFYSAQCKPSSISSHLNKSHNLTLDKAPRIYLYNNTIHSSIPQAFSEQNGSPIFYYLHPLLLQDSSDALLHSLQSTCYHGSYCGLRSRLSPSRKEQGSSAELPAAVYYLFYTPERHLESRLVSKVFYEYKRCLPAR